jgi:hypothetical protein
MLGEVGRVRIEDVVSNTLVFSWLDRVLRKQLTGRYSNSIQPERCVRAIEIRRHLVVLEEASRIGQAEPPICHTPVYKKDSREDRFSECCKVAWRDKCEVRVRGNRILDTLPSQLACGGEVVVSTPVAIAEGGELYGTCQLFPLLQKWNAHFLKERFVEAVIVPEICVGCTTKKAWLVSSISMK